MEELKELELGKIYDIEFERKEPGTEDEMKKQEVEYMVFHAIQKMSDKTLYVFISGFAEFKNEIIALEDGSFIDGTGRCLGFKESEKRFIKNIRLCESVLKEKADSEFGENAYKVIEFVRGL